MQTTLFPTPTTTRPFVTLKPYSQHVARGVMGTDEGYTDPPPVPKNVGGKTS